MEKLMLMAVILLFSMHLNMTLQNPPREEPNDFLELAQVYQEYGLPVDGIVLSGWFPLEHKRQAEQYLAQHWQLQAGERGKRITWQDGSVLRIVRSGQQGLEMELITDNLALANEQYSLWRQFACQFAQGQPVGITLCSNYEEQLGANACYRLADDVTRSLKAALTTNIQEEGHQSYTFYSPLLSQQLNVNGTVLNGNLAFVQHDERTTMYFGSPVIYQQY